MRGSFVLGIMFNIIDGSLGVNADLVPLSREPEYQVAFKRRVRCMVVDPKGNESEIWCARAEDIIVGKLMAWQEGRSAKHPSDIYVVLSFMFANPNTSDFDADYVTTRAARIGDDALKLWQKLLDRVRAEISEHPPPF